MTYQIKSFTRFLLKDFALMTRITEVILFVSLIIPITYYSYLFGLQVHPFLEVSMIIFLLAFVKDDSRISYYIPPFYKANLIVGIIGLSLNRLGGGSASVVMTLTIVIALGGVMGFIGYLAIMLSRKLSFVAYNYENNWKSEYILVTGDMEEALRRNGLEESYGKTLAYLDVEVSKEMTLIMEFRPLDENDKSRIRGLICSVREFTYEGITCREEEKRRRDELRSTYADILGILKSKQWGSESYVV